MDRIKNIVDAGLFQGWSVSNMVLQIKYEIATEEERNLLFLTDDIPELTERAEAVYEKYRKEYFK